MPCSLSHRVPIFPSKAIDAEFAPFTLEAYEVLPFDSNTFFTVGDEVGGRVVVVVGFAEIVGVSVIILYVGWGVGGDVEPIFPKTCISKMLYP